MPCLYPSSKRLMNFHFPCYKYWQDKRNKMRRLNKTLYSISTALVLLLFSPSCINDDLSECVTDKKIYFRYTEATRTYNGIDYREGINPEEVTRMNLYVFDAQDKFVGEYIDPSPKLSSKYYMTIPAHDLRPGKYKFIAWGSLRDDYYRISSDELVPGQTTLDELELHLGCIKDGMVTDSLSSLFYANYNNNGTFEVTAMDEQSIPLDMVQNTYKITVEVAGLDTVSLKDSYRFNISDDNGKYKFDNSFASCEKFQYTAPCLRDSLKDELRSGLNVMRLASNRSPMLNIERDESEFPIVEDNLVALITAASASGADIDFTRHFNFHIRYELDVTSPTTVIIYINGWRLVKQDGILK